MDRVSDPKIRLLMSSADIVIVRALKIYGAARPIDEQWTEEARQVCH